MEPQFVCKCGKQKGWLHHGTITLPCPHCGRKYIGCFSARKHGIIGKEIKEPLIKRILHFIRHPLATIRRYRK